MTNQSETYQFEINLPKHQTFISEKYQCYERFVKDCEKKCKALHAHIDDVKILCTSEYGNTFIRSPEHGELAI